MRSYAGLWQSTSSAAAAWPERIDPRMQPPPDTPEQVDRLLTLGCTRSVELNGCGIWAHPDHPNVSWHGAANALAALSGQPIPYPANPMFPALG